MHAKAKEEVKNEISVHKNSLWNYLFRLETTNPLSKASLQTCEPTKPLPPSTSSYIDTNVRGSSVILTEDGTQEQTHSQIVSNMPKTYNELHQLYQKENISRNKTVYM